MREADAAFAKAGRLKMGSAFAWLMQGTSSMMRGRVAKAHAAMQRTFALNVTAKSKQWPRERRRVLPKLALPDDPG